MTDLGPFQIVGASGVGLGLGYLLLKKYMWTEDTDNTSDKDGGYAEIDKDYTDYGGDPETHGFEKDWDRPPADPNRDVIPPNAMGACPAGYRKVVWYGGKGGGGSACLPIIEQAYKGAGV